MAVADYIIRGWEWLTSQILSSHEKRILRLEDNMSDLSDKITEINDASNREAGAVRDIATALSDLRAEVEAGGIPSDTIARLDIARADFLTALAADPANPVPEPPAPTPDPGPAPEPTT